MRRLFGIETEYGLAVADCDPAGLVAASRSVVSACPSPCVDRWNYGFEDPRRDLRGYRVEQLQRDPRDQAFDARGPRFTSLAEEHADRVLANGARLYNDHGHPEYCTPECASLKALVAHDLAGERIVLGCAQRYAAQSGKRISVIKNNTDFHGASYGTHESYLMRRDVPFQRVLAVLVPFLATRPIFAGAGKVGSDTDGRGGVVYQMSQRAEFVDVVASVDTQYRRPLVNTRDEPHASRDLYRRLHVICGDANRSPWATAMKVGTLVLVLDRMEAGWEPGFELEDPVRAVHLVSRDMTLQQKMPVRWRDGTRREMTALEIQRFYLEAVREQPSELPERDWVEQEWRRVLEDLAESPHAAADRVDWIAKQVVLDEYRQSSETGEPDLDALRSVDLAYHDVNPDESLFPAVAEHVGMQALVTESEVEHAMEHPPADTRAWVRGHFVRHYPEAVCAVGWNGLVFRHGGQERLFDMNALVDGHMMELNSMLGEARTLEETAVVLERYQAVLAGHALDREETEP